MIRSPLVRLAAAGLASAVLAGCISYSSNPPAKVVVQQPAAPTSPGGPSPGHWSWMNNQWVWVAD